MFSKNSNNRIVLLATFFLLAQFYFTVLSTQHAFMDMPTICPICTVAGDLDHATSFAIPPIFLNKSTLTSDQYTSASIVRFTAGFESRAPPSA